MILHIIINFNKFSFFPIRLMIILSIIIHSSIVYGQNTDANVSEQQLWEYFKDSDWSYVFKAKYHLENLGKDIIPELVNLVQDTTTVKLINTGDLIYPGVTEFFGHGGIINYDLDRISGRAGWLLEELTFMNFGYVLQSLSKEEQISSLESGFGLFNKEKLSDFADNSSFSIHQFRVYLVREWWSENKNNWNRIGALTDALLSNDPFRQSKVLHFVEYGDTKCKGFTEGYYVQKISPVILELKSSKYETVSDAANNFDKFDFIEESYGYDSKREMSLYKINE